MTSLYLVRHGETDWNRERRIQGSTDIPLNQTGRSQAASTGKLLASRRWDRVITSPLSRAAETAAIIAAAVGLPQPEENAELVERRYGDAEGLNYAQVDEQFPGETPVPGRESREEVAARATAALLALAVAHPGQSLIVVSHGGVIRSMLGAVEPGTTHGMISNGSVHSFQVADGSLELIAFDDPIDELSLECGTDDIDDQNALEHRDAVPR